MPSFIALSHRGEEASELAQLQVFQERRIEVLSHMDGLKREKSPGLDTGFSINMPHFFQLSLNHIAIGGGDKLKLPPVILMHFENVFSSFR